MQFIRRLLGRASEPPPDDRMDISQRHEQTQKMKLASGLEANLKTLSQLCGDSADLRIRRFTISQLPAAQICLDGMVEDTAVEEILRALMIDTRKMGLDPGTRRELIKSLENLMVVANINRVDGFGDLFARMALGDTAILVDGHAEAILCETTGWQTRAIKEPDAEMSVRGPREGFVESVITNISLIRRRIRVPHLWVENHEIGKLTRTTVSIVYIKGLATEDVLGELRERIGRIEIDGILEGGQLEDYIEDTPYTLFPMLLRTERPDVVCRSLLEGRVAVLVNGTPHALILPAEFSTFLQAPDDYYERVPIGSFIRVLRWASALLAIMLPAVYVAVTNFHPELIPVALALRISATREGVPFPLIVEVLGLGLLFEILREAGLRLPAAIGPAISIVGALVVGEAAIRAGLVSPAVVVVIALTAIAGFGIPVFSAAIAFRLLQLTYTLLGAAFGLLGVQFGLLLTVVHLCSLRSFGVPYLTPVAPFIVQDMKDNVLRSWWWSLETRPKLIGYREPKRQPSGQMPSPGETSGEGGEEK